jgi:cytochrome c peroxidase
MGEAVGAGMYQKLGLVKPVPGLKDNGRFEATKKDADKFFFKVPSLRNIEKTAPYLHDGSLKTLEETVAFMGTYQLGKDLKKEEVDSIVTFLKALTGPLPKDVKPPKALPSGKSTPKPDPT